MRSALESPFPNNTGPLVKAGPFPTVEDAYRISRKAEAGDERFEDKRWFVVVTAPRQEDRVKTRLGRLGALAWTPELKEWRRHLGRRGEAGRRAAVSSPLFPCYVFIGFASDRAPNFPAITSLDGVSSIVHTAGAPKEVPPRIVLELARRQTRGEWDRTRDRPPRIEKGSRVMITTGLLANRFGTVAGLPSGERVKLLLDEIGLSATIESDALRVLA